MFPRFSLFLFLFFLLADVEKFSRVSYTLNFDGSHNNQAQRAGAGCIIRDDSGELVVAAAYNLVGPASRFEYVAIAEAIGLRNGLRLARERNLTLSVIKGVNQEVVDLVIGQGRRQPQPLTSIIEEIKGNLGRASLQGIDRASNKVAHKLASMGSSLVTESKVFTTYDAPIQIFELIHQDKLRNGGEDNRLANGGIHNVGNVAARNRGEDNHLGNGILAVGLLAAAALALWGAFTRASNIMRLLGVITLALSIAINGIHTTSIQAIGAAVLLGVITLASNLMCILNNINVSIVATGAALLWGAITLARNLMRSLNSNNAHYTLEYFGSDRNQLQKASAGCIIRNERKFFVAAAYNLDDRYPDCHVAVAEAIALQKGLKLAKDNSVQLDLINGRNPEVRERVLGLEKKPPKTSQLSDIIQEIKFDLRKQGIKPTDHNLKLVDEETIKVAKKLAAWGGVLDKEAEVYNSLDDLPPGAAQLFVNAPFA